MRGTVNDVTLMPFEVGITPAHAGNRASKSAGRGRRKDHPRSCGEQFLIIPSPPLNAGSPPLMRGTAKVDLDWWSITGITPAHAGNSDCVFLYGLAFKDHPRSCGEQLYY